MSTARFSSYKQVAEKDIRNCSLAIADLSPDALSQIAEQGLAYMLSGLSDTTCPAFSISQIDLQGVRNAVVLVEVATVDGSEFREISGLARLISNKSGVPGPIPLVYIFNGAVDSIPHELVHICQYLLPTAYPLRPEDRRKFLDCPEHLHLTQSALKTNGKKAARELLVSLVSYSFWIECEAVYETGERDFWNWLRHAHQVAMPFTKFENIHHLLGWNHSDMLESSKEFMAFCYAMRKEVDWMSELFGGFDVCDSLERVYDEMKYGFPVDDDSWDFDENNDPWDFDEE